jgi:hypothetical protein
MSDLKIITETNYIEHPRPPQPGEPSEYFGEQSNDLQLDNINDLATLSGIDKLRQDLNKIFLTEVGKNINFEIYGTDLQTLVGNKVNIEEIKAHLKDQVETALATLLLVNADNTNDDEVPNIFESLSVEQIALGKFEIRVSVISRSGKRAITDTIVLS